MRFIIHSLEMDSDDDKSCYIGNSEGIKVDLYAEWMNGDREKIKIKNWFDSKMQLPYKG